MRRMWTLLLLLLLPAPGLAGEAPARDGARHRATADLFITVPLDRYSTDVIFPFGGSHHAVPGVVAVNSAPYYCAPHDRAFTSRAAFVAHLQSRHGLEDRDIPRAVLVERGQVRYVGDGKR